MSTDLSARLNDINDLAADEQPGALTALGNDVVAAQAVGDTNGLIGSTIDAIVSLIEQGLGTGKERLALGEVLGQLGDPRVHRPSDAGYWADVNLDEGGAIRVGRFPVSTAEFQEWVSDGGYDDDKHWSDEGLVWRDSGEPRWSDLAADPEVAHLVVANQPAVGMNWYEADAYARSVGARLLSSTERRWVVRGSERRPYPWGQPFGHGNANTREEALGKPCAMGLFRADTTPDGVSDLAGNVAEWLADGSEGSRVLHPGSWVRPSMAAWAKALELAKPTTRSADLGFRLARSS